MTTTTAIRVVIAEDHAVTRLGLRCILDGAADLSVVGEAETGSEAVALLARLRPDVALVDLRLPEVDGVAVTTATKEDWPATRVIVLTSSEGSEDIYNALKAGADAYLLKDVRPAALLKTVRDVHAGRRVIPPDVAVRLAERVPQSDLSARERDVLEQIVAGRSNKEAAAALGLAETTVKTHVTAILGKLGVSDRTQAALAAVRRGIVRA